VGDMGVEVKVEIAVIRSLMTILWKIEVKN